jgi:hypothetical protein
MEMFKKSLSSVNEAEYFGSLLTSTSDKKVEEVRTMMLED